MYCLVYEAMVQKESKKKKFHPFALKWSVCIMRTWKHVQRLKRLWKAGSWKSWAASQIFIKTAYLLKKRAALTIVLPEDSEDSELEEEGDMDEVGCLLEEVNPQGPLTSSKGRSYHEAGRIIRMPPTSSVPSRLVVWPTRNKCKLLQVCGECECAPAVYQWRWQDGYESTGVRLRSTPTMTNRRDCSPGDPLTNHWSVND